MSALGVSGATPTTVAASGGLTIYGVGASFVSSILLGTPGSFVVLMADGAGHWLVIAGQPDSGWVALTLASGGGFGSGDVLPASGFDSTPSARLVGSTVGLKGVLENNMGGSLGALSTWATAPSSMRASEHSATSFGDHVSLGVLTVMARSMSMRQGGVCSAAKSASTTGSTRR
jgi:hypothetical protein